MNARHVFARLRERADRGATVVEYALIAGLVGITSMGAIELASNTMHDSLDASMSDVSTGVVQESGGGGGGGVTSTTASSGGGGGGATTSTTAAPTTSTTAAPTTTSTTMRSTTKPAWSNTSSNWESPSKKQWEASTQLVVYDNVGLPLPNGVEVRVRITIDGESTTKWITVSNRRVDIEVGDIDDGDKNVKIEVIDVRNDDDWWNGQTSSVTINRP